MRFLELPWVFVPIWVFTILLDVLYTADVGPKTLRCALRLAFGHSATHALLYAALIILTYLQFAQFLLSGQSEMTFLVSNDPVIGLLYLFTSHLFPGLDPITGLFYALMGEGIIYAVLWGSMTALYTGVVSERHRTRRLRDEAFSSEDPEAFLDRLIAEASTGPAKPHMKQVLSDLKHLASVGDTKGAIIGKALERSGKGQGSCPSEQSGS